MSRTLPPMLQVMKNIGGVEVPEFLALARLQGEPPSSKPATNGHVDRMKSAE